MTSTPAIKFLDQKDQNPNKISQYELVNTLHEDNEK